MKHFIARGTVLFKYRNNVKLWASFGLTFRLHVYADALSAADMRQKPMLDMLQELYTGSVMKRYIVAGWFAEVKEVQ